MRALIVDDEHISRLVLQEMLRPHGECEPVGTGGEAVTAFARALDGKRPFDLVLLDIEMPGMDGHRTLQEIRQIEAARGLTGAQAAKVMMVTVRKDPESVYAAFRGQCEAYLIKPVSREALESHLLHMRLIPAKP